MMNDIANNDQWNDVNSEIMPAWVRVRRLTALESGRGPPTLEQLSKIASVLGLEVTLTQKRSDAAS